MNNRNSFRLVCLLMLGWGLVETTIGFAQKQSTTQPQAASKTTTKVKKEDAAALSEFNRRVAEYVTLRKKVEKIPGVPAKAEPEVIAAHKKQTVGAIQAARQGARAGDIFGTAEPYFRRLLASNLRKDAEAKDTILTDGNPRAADSTTTAPVTITVNAAYPEKAPVSTVPAMLLLRMPQLPEELNYRFVGRHLILLDVHARIIIDYLLDVVP